MDNNHYYKKATGRCNDYCCSRCYGGKNVAALKRSVRRHERQKMRAEIAEDLRLVRQDKREVT